MWVDAAPCAATLAAAVAESTLLAKIVGPTGNATTPISISNYEFAVATNLTLPCPTSGALAGAALLRGAVALVAAAAALAL